MKFFVVPKKHIILERVEPARLASQREAGGGIAPGQRQFATGKSSIARILASALRFLKFHIQRNILPLFTERDNLERVGGIEPPTKPWEGLVLPLNHTRQRSAVYALLTVLASFALLISPVHAEDVTPVTPYHFDENLISSGWTLRLLTGANLTVFPGVLPAPADVSWSVSTDAVPTLPADTKLVGSLYRATITGVTTLNTTKWKLAATLPDTAGYWSKSIWMYDLSTNTWTRLASTLNAKTGKWQAGYTSLDAYLAVLQDSTTQVGIASWYCRLHCSSRYPKLHGTSNDFPVGTKVKVNNLENGKSVTVKIISKWGQPAGRIVDLSGAAYDLLKASNKGVTKVSVTSNLATVITPAVTPVSTTPAETYLSLTPKAKNSTAAPIVSATSYSVIDAATGTVLVEKNSDTVQSIASVTKLMTVVVFLDTKPKLTDKFVYAANDGTGKDATGIAYGYNNLTLKTGDSVQERDLLYATLVGSANNGATSLVRASGLTRAEFVDRMNTKAKSWGMNETTFVEPSGLDPKNISTAADLVILGNRAFHEYEPIRYVTTKSSYTFTASKSGNHTVRTTDTLLTHKNGLTVTGGKTGYIDESKYTYVVRLKNAQGAHIVISMLGSSSSASRFNEAAALANWTWNNVTWS